MSKQVSKCCEAKVEYGNFAPPTPQGRCSKCWKPFIPQGECQHEIENNMTLDHCRKCGKDLYLISKEEECTFTIIAGAPLCDNDSCKKHFPVISRQDSLRERENIIEMSSPSPREGYEPSFIIAEAISKIPHAGENDRGELLLRYIDVQNVVGACVEKEIYNEKRRCVKLLDKKDIECSARIDKFVGIAVADKVEEVRAEIKNLPCQAEVVNDDGTKRITR